MHVLIKINSLPRDFIKYSICNKFWRLNIVEGLIQLSAALDPFNLILTNVIILYDPLNTVNTTKWPEIDLTMNIDVQNPHSQALAIMVMNKNL